MKKNVKVEVSEIDFPNNIKEKMISNNIKILEQIWELSRSDLKKMGFSNNEVNEIIVKLQLYGLDLNKKVY